MNGLLLLGLLLCLHALQLHNFVLQLRGFSLVFGLDLGHFCLSQFLGRVQLWRALSAAWDDCPYTTHLELVHVEFYEPLGDCLIDDEIVVVSTFHNGVQDFGGTVVPAHFVFFGQHFAQQRGICAEGM